MTATADARRRLGLASAAALVVANMVGAGLFTTSGYALADLGDRRVVLLSWALGGVIAALGALCYGALAVRYPHSGGEYEFLRRTLGPTVGVFAGLVSLLAGFAAPIAFAAKALEAYAWPLLGLEVPAWPLLGTAVIAVASVLHGRGVELGAGVQNGVVALKLIMLVGLLAAGAWVLLGSGAPPAGRPAPERVDWLAFAQSSTWVYLAYSGWNAAVYLGGEVRRPERTLPRSLLLGTGLVAALYLGLNAVFLWSAPVADLAGKEQVAQIAAEALLGGAGGGLVGAVVVLALLTSVTSMVMAGPRVAERMAEDGVLPAALRRRGDGPPRAAIALQALLASVFLWSTTLYGLMTYLGFTLSACAGLTVIGLIVQRRRDGAQRLPIPGWPLVPLLFVGGVGVLAGLTLLRDPGPALLALLSAIAAAVLARRGGGDRGVVS